MAGSTGVAGCAAFFAVLLLAGCGSSSSVTSPDAGPASGASPGGAGATPVGASYPPVDNAPPPQAANIDKTVPSAAPGSVGRCDRLDTSECLFPFPNDYFTVTDDGSVTGRRVHFAVASMPKSSVVLGAHVNPAEWNRNDGFSPGSAILLHVDGVDLEASRAPAIGDLPRALAQDSPVLLIDAKTLQRQLCWAELDANATDPSRQALIVHPAQALRGGHRYIVALRDLRDARDKIIPAPALFRIFRDNHRSDIASVKARRAHMESIFETLGAAGVPRGDVYLAWDFTVASRQNLTGRLLHIRDDAFKSLAGAAPKFSVTKVTDYSKPQNANVMRVVQGVVTVPSYLAIPDSEAPLNPVLGAIDNAIDLGKLLDPVIDAIGKLTGGAGGAIPFSLLKKVVPLLADQDLPLIGFHYDASTVKHPDALPARIPGATLAAPFTCIIPRSAVDADGGVHPARISLYGHGLFDSRGAVTAGHVEAFAEQYDFVLCDTNWLGFSDGDIPNAVLMLLDISNEPSFADNLQQGILNVLVLGRLMLRPDGLASQPAFQAGAPARSVLDTQALYYYGNSEAGILGGTVVAVSRDVRRAELGATGMDYANLLVQRSSDFSTFAPFLYMAYPDTLDQQLVLGLLQMLWDRADPDGYAPYMTDSPLPDTPPHKVLMQVAWGDHQVSLWAAQMEARSIGAAVHCPVLAPGRAVDRFPYYGIPCIPTGEADAYPGSAMVVWDMGPRVEAPPQTNTPPGSGHDPHDDVERLPAARLQRSMFLQPDGRVVDVCHGGACGVSTDEGGVH